MTGIIVGSVLALVTLAWVLAPIWTSARLKDRDVL